VAEKKIIQISRQEVLFLRKMISQVYNKSIERPGDKYSYEELSQHISENLKIDPKDQKHSAGLLHKLMHDEGQNREFLDTCYRFISENQYDREGYIDNIGFDTDTKLDVSKQKEIWKKRFQYLSVAVCIASVLALGLLLKSWINHKNQPIVWNMTAAWSADSYTYQNYLEIFTQQIYNQTGGKFEIRILPDYQLPTSNGHNRTKEEVQEALTENTIQILHSGPHINFKDNPEAVMFSTIPFGKTYSQMVSWMRQPKIKETYLRMYDSQNILTYPGGHSGPQFGGWYKEMPKDTSFFKGKNVRFANFAGYLLSHPSIGAKLKPMLRYQFDKMVDRINFDVIEWQNPEEDVSIGIHYKGFRYYDRSNWNEPNSMFSFYINKDAFNDLPRELRDILIKTIEKIGEQKIFKDDNLSRQIAENTIENTYIPDCKCYIKIFDLQSDAPELYDFLKRQNEKVVNDFVSKHPQIKWLYEDYLKN
jgi:TRAP-type mannitol/chloroaromatic compound transport system substrate-binding protein